MRPAKARMAYLSPYRLKTRAPRPALESSNRAIPSPQQEKMAKKEMRAPRAE